MTLTELISAFRNLTFDIRPEKYLWSDEEVTLYLNEAEREASQRANLIYDEINPEVVDVTIDSGASLVELNETIFYIDRVALEDGSVLERTTRDYLDEEVPGWSVITSSKPSKFFVIEGIASEVLYVVPKPVEAVNLKLSVYRTPLAPMESPDDEPEIHPRYHFRLIDWALNLAYRKEDSETKDLDKAERHAAAFAMSFGLGVNENVRRMRRRTRRNTIRMNEDW